MNQNSHMYFSRFISFISNRYFGTATKVKRKGTKRRGHPESYSIDIKFDDQSTDVFDYPSPDVQILTVEGDEAFVEMEDGSRVVAYEGSLTDLSMGDLVEGHYQDGAENDSWFRGRVAAVNAATNTCDIVYFDKDVSFLLYSDTDEVFAMSLTCRERSVRERYPHR